MTGGKNRILGSISSTLLHAAFTCVDPESAKKDCQVKQLFAFSGSAPVKAAHNNVDEIDPSSSSTKCDL